MSLDAVNSYAPIVTALIIAATAMMSARRRLTDHLDSLLTDAGFRTFVANQFIGKPTTDVPDLWIEIWQSANIIGNQFESLGNMIINGLIDRDIFLRGYAWVIAATWARLEKYIALLRQAEKGDELWEDFEYLTVLARAWIEVHPNSYPRSAKRILPSFEEHAV